MNLCGTELPLATNRDMVERLRLLGNTTYIPTGGVDERTWRIRFTNKYLPDRKGYPRKTNETFGKPPFGMKLYKSSTYVIMTYAFANFVLRKGSLNSEEHFYSTLFHLREAPVGKAPIEPTLSVSIWINDYSANIAHERMKCNGEERNEVCIAGVGTMKSINTSEAFFFNKYFARQDHVIMDCVEERIVARNRLEYSKDCFSM